MPHVFEVFKKLRPFLSEDYYLLLPQWKWIEADPVLMLRRVQRRKDS